MNYLKEILDYVSKLFQWWVVVQPWEQGLKTRFGKNVKLLSHGVWFRLPFFDCVYLQTVRLRVVSMPLQTITTKDGKTLSICSAVGYSINDILKLYNSLHNPETTIYNLVLSEISDYVANHELTECGHKQLESVVLNKLSTSDYGIKYEYVKILGYAVVRTYRLLQDGHWNPDGLSLETIK